MANKKILFISDFNLNHTPGGAQRSNDLIINKLGLNSILLIYNLSLYLFTLGLI